MTANLYNKVRWLLILCCVVGTVVPWALFLNYFANFEITLGGILAHLTGNPLAAGFVVDLLISSVIFLIWSFYDLGRANRKRWFIVLLANLSVGLSLALPLYLLFKLQLRQR